jgi:hypothetical protein
MHAKGSIPASAKLFAISAAVVAIIAVLVAAPWREALGRPCAVLHENIELVQSGQAQRRVSDAFTFNQNNRGRIKVSTGEGDFDGVLTLDSLRDCLGEGWSETHATVQAEGYGDAWVFSRSGEPLVMYVQGRNDGYRRVEMKIIVERAG